MKCIVIVRVVVVWENLLDFTDPPPIYKQTNKQETHAHPRLATRYTIFSFLILFSRTKVQTTGEKVKEQMNNVVCVLVAVVVDYYGK